MNYEELVALQERVNTAKSTDRRRGDRKATSDLIDELVKEFRLRTLDGEPIRCGMRIVDYNMKWTTVIGISSVDMYSGVWFETANGGMFDSTRLWARMP